MNSADIDLPPCGPTHVEIKLQSLARFARRLSGIAAVIVGAHWLSGADRIPSSGTLQLVNNWVLPGAFELDILPHEDIPLHQAVSRDSVRLLSSASLSSTSQSSHSSSHGSSHQSSSCSGHGEDNTLDTMFSVLMFTFVACNVIEHCNMFVPIAWRFPISVMMFISGGVAGVIFLHIYDSPDDFLFSNLRNLLQGIEGAAWIDPHALLYIVLPPLLYESASAMNWHAIRKVLPSAVILALPGVILNTFLTGSFVRIAFRIDGEQPHWSVSLLLGSILSATDPVAVVSALAALGAPKKLSSLVEGESLLNDGSAVVIFNVFKDWVIEDAPKEERKCEELTPGCIVGSFFVVAFGGALIGVLHGKILIFWIRHARSLHNAVLEVAVILSAIYLSFFVAEHVKTSGVLATVTLGLMMSSGGASRLSHHGRHNHHVILQQVGYACNQVAFFVGGIVSARFFKHDGCSHSAEKGSAWRELFALYFVVHLTRGLVILCFWPVLKRIGYGITWKEAVILVYGGLRGAVGLILGLIVEHTDPRWMDPNISQMIAFHTSGIVLMTLFINGSTIDGLYKRLRLYPINEFRKTHLRKVFFKLEAECQTAGIKECARHWFFKDCNIRKVVRCVPSFKHIHFDVAGIAKPDKILSIHHALNSLMQESDVHREKAFERQASWGSPTGCPELKETWRRKKEKESEQNFEELVNDSQTEAVAVKDAMINITNTGDRELNYRPQERRALPGFYVSSRPLGALKAEDDEVNYFYVKFQKLERVAIIVGLVSNIEDITGFRPGPGAEGQVLGAIAPNSIGFNTATGVMQYQGFAGPGMPDQGVPEAIESGDIIRIIYERPPSSDWEVRLEVVRRSEVKYRLCCSFGPFDPDEVYPAVEFRCEDESLMESTRNSTGLSGRTGELNSQLPGAIGDVAEGLYTAVTDVVDRIDSAKHKVVNNTRASFIATAEVVNAVLPKRMSCQGSNQTDSDEPPSKTPNPSKETRKSNQWSVSAKVDLSYEPQLASGAESINELFHVLFNTVMMKYTDYHEHGIIGNRALAWLTEAVSLGMDCANCEVGAMHAHDFRVSPSGTTNLQLALASPQSADSPGGDLIKAHSQKTNFSTPSSLLGASSNVRRMRGIFGKLRSNAAKEQLVGLFEPIVVEYLSLESMTSSTSMFDNFPHSWERARLLGFGMTKAKISALWAFVEAHEKFLKDSPSTARFPDLVRCIGIVVAEAKRDIYLIEQLQPRRFFFSKHVLMLRVILFRRHHRLEKYINEGWITPGDASGFQEEFHERMHALEQYIPRLGRGWNFFRLDEYKDHQAENLDPSDRTSTNAWDDIDLSREATKPRPTPQFKSKTKILGDDDQRGSVRHRSAPGAHRDAATPTAADVSKMKEDAKALALNMENAKRKEHTSSEMPTKDDSSADSCSQREDILGSQQAKARMGDAGMEQVLPGGASAPKVVHPDFGLVSMRVDDDSVSDSVVAVSPRQGAAATATPLSVVPATSEASDTVKAITPQDPLAKQVAAVQEIEIPV